MTNKGIVKLYKRIARDFDAWTNCVKHGNDSWRDRWQDDIEQLCRDHLPSGSGFDAGTTFNFEASRHNRLVFHTSYHHMTDCGFYDGWTEHDVVVTPDFCYGLDVNVKGRDRDMIKDYVAEVMTDALDSDVLEWRSNEED